jgi:hypothetical protein
MNTFSYFIIGILLLSNQALAAKAVAEKIERISVDTFRLTMGEPVQGWEGFLTKTTPPYIQYVICHGETNYLGDQNNNTRSSFKLTLSIADNTAVSFHSH